MRPQVLRRAVVVGVSVASLPVLGIVAAPAANAEPLPNGLSVDCSPQPGQENMAICIVSGCPRVNGDYVVDALHWSVAERFEQHEVGFKCINGETARVPAPANFATTGGRREARISVQACRK